MLAWVIGCLLVSAIDVNAQKPPVAAVLEDESGYFTFGYDISMDQGFMAVGTEGRNFDGPTTGMVYIYRHRDGQWHEDGVLRPDDPNAMEGFGSTVALFGDWCVVGAPGANAAYVFRRETGVWSKFGKLTGAEVGSRGAFGASVSIHDGWLAVGAPNSHPKNMTGAVYVYRLDGTWIQHAVLKPDEPKPGNSFGMRIRVHENRCLVSAPEENETKGAVYIFKVNEKGDWIQEAWFTSDGDNEMFFGNQIAFSGTHAAICSEQMCSHGGRVYVYEHKNGMWEHQTTLIADPERDEAPFFGSDVAMNKTTLVTGAGSGKRFSPLVVFELEDGCWVRRHKLTIDDSDLPNRSMREFEISGGDIALGTSTNQTPGLVHTFTRVADHGWQPSTTLRGKGLTERGYSHEPMVKKMEEIPPALTQEQIKAMSLVEVRGASMWRSHALGKANVRADAALSARLQQEFKWLVERVMELNEEREQNR